MESFVISGKAKNVFRLIELKAKMEQATLERKQAAKRIQSNGVIARIRRNKWKIK